MDIITGTADFGAFVNTMKNEIEGTYETKCYAKMHLPTLSVLTFPFSAGLGYREIRRLG